MYKLHFFRQGYKLRSWELNADTATNVGRGAGNDVSFTDMTVSRKQFSITCQSGKWILRDLSGRGTYVNGNLVEETELEVGAIIMFGSNMRAIFLNDQDDQHHETTKIQFGV
jgi:pSer/pThr/pTyr-binding forkhead associated (FHA) protein